MPFSDGNRGAAASTVGVGGIRRRQRQRWQRTTCVAAAAPGGGARCMRGSGGTRHTTRGAGALGVGRSDADVRWPVYELRQAAALLRSSSSQIPEADGLLRHGVASGGRQQVASCAACPAPGRWPACAVCRSRRPSSFLYMVGLPVPWRYFLDFFGESVNLNCCDFFWGFFFFK